MLIETFDFGVEVRALHLLLGLALGAIFGIAAQISRFCLRRAVAGAPGERGSATGVWLAAFATAMLALQLFVAAGLADLGDHRWYAADLPLVGLVVGGLAFGIGMVLTRGCVSRLTVLASGGNLRALGVILVFTIVAHATLKGVLAPLRTALTSVTVNAPYAAPSELPGGALLWAVALALPALFLAMRSTARRRDLALGGLIGLLAAVGWAMTSVLLMDAFEPQPVQSLAFTLPWSDTLFWTIASTSIQPGFGVGLVAGVIGGAFLSALARGEAKLESFETPRQTLRYLAGAVLMGIGGVLAGGCSVGAGLSGTATLSLAALIVLAAIVIGAKATGLALERNERALHAAA
ncbi:YeeE/YedE family protein [Sulfitobacter sp. D35]|uniref:YeeE/YedE family protein n=1 Tax=Sulfitobacter sp. D35 TaxID=3083252 RepID=UPI00296F0A1D|nr:YeeE/YedE family protein [Sulfitobacter sp. D35]MDW4499525.1 YeeE/YedE family protein [Sulfitobacter sp. D35]